MTTEELARRFPHARKHTVTETSVDEDGQFVAGGEISVDQAVRVHDRCRDAERLRGAKPTVPMRINTVRPAVHSRPRERRERRSSSRGGDSGDDGSGLADPPRGPRASDPRHISHAVAQLGFLAGGGGGVSATYLDGGGRRLLDCPLCGQAARVWRRGERLAVRCFAGCAEEAVLEALRRGQEAPPPPSDPIAPMDPVWGFQFDEEQKRQLREGR